MTLKSKIKFALTMLCSIVGIVNATAQVPLELTFNKTSSIIFPTAISAVDRGSRDILAQKVKGVDNVLQLKAGRANFKETNLTVITLDGELHQFVVRYADAPRTFTIHVAGDHGPSSPVLFKQETTSAELEETADLILNNLDSHTIKTTSGNQMRLALQGIYIQDNTLHYHLKITNNSNIPFHTDMLRFYVRDRQKVKRTASQEVAQIPVYHKGNTAVFNGKSTEEVVFAIPKFTIPDAKVLVIELMEKNGGRHLRLPIRNKSIIKARLVPGL